MPFDIEKEIREANAAYVRALINHSDPTIGFALPWFLTKDYADCKVPDLTELRHVK